MRNTIGVIIPVYNTEKYINQCIDSVLSQSISFDEIIIVNDGSTDRSKEICENYAKENCTIKLINQENKGQAIARNVGMTNSSSEYICFLDSDDYLRNDYVEKVKETIKDADLDILYFDAETVSDYSGIRVRDQYNISNIAPRDVKTGIDFFVDCYPEGYRESPCLVALKLDYLKSINAQFPPVRIFEDNYFSFITAINAKSVKYIPEKLYIRRYRENSTMTSAMTYEKWSQLVFCIEMCWDYINNSLAKWDDTKKDAFLRFYCNSLITIYHASNKVEDTNAIKNIEKDLNRLQDKLAEEIDNITINDLSFETAKTFTEFQMIFRKVNKKLWGKLYGSPAYATMAYNKYLRTLGLYLKKLPLSSSKRVGIYGAGIHTDRLMQWYEKIVGRINAEVFYIETDCVSGQKFYYGRPIINVNEIFKYNIEEIIISSVLYEKDMFKILNEELNYKGVIHRFYEKSSKDMFLEQRYIPFNLD